MSSLISHQAIHQQTNPSIYSCGSCKKNFSNRKNFERHVKIHKNVKYKCEICETITSARRDNIRRHIKHLHSEIDESEISKYVVEYIPRRDSVKGLTDSLPKNTAAEINKDQETISVLNNRVNVIQSIGNPQKILNVSETIDEISKTKIFDKETVNQVQREREIKLPPKKNLIALGLKKHSQNTLTKSKYNPIEQYRKILLGTLHPSHQTEEDEHSSTTQIHWRKRASINFLHHQ